MRRHKRRNLTKRETEDLIGFMREMLDRAGIIQMTCGCNTPEAEAAREMGKVARKYLEARAPETLPAGQAHSTGQFMGES